LGWGKNRRSCRTQIFVFKAREKGGKARGRIAQRKRVWGTRVWERKRGELLLGGRGEGGHGFSPEIVLNLVVGGREVRTKIRKRRISSAGRKREALAFFSKGVGGLNAGWGRKVVCQPGKRPSLWNAFLGQKGVGGRGVFFPGCGLLPPERKFLTIYREKGGRYFPPKGDSCPWAARESARNRAPLGRESILVRPNEFFRGEKKPAAEEGTTPYES